jgi:2-amino-4-hydroxy-6-hydroxymethyldihydropteridine diphosphokinase
VKSEQQPTVFIALGSNLGDARANILSAIKRLQQFSGRPLAGSSLLQTEPVDCPPGSPMFLNAVVGLVPKRGLTPESLLAKLKSLEKEFGRQPKKVLNEPRPLDLDLIAFGNERRASEALTLPHPRAHERRFVLQPLSEIAPDLILAGQSKTVKELLSQLPEAQSGGGGSCATDCACDA